MKTQRTKDLINFLGLKQRAKPTPADWEGERGSRISGRYGKKSRWKVVETRRENPVMEEKCSRHGSIGGRVWCVEKSLC